MNKLFKTTLLAAMVAGSFAANAATIASSTAVTTPLSAEGIAAGEVDATGFTFTVVATKEHPASSTITLTFSDSVDLTGVTTGDVTFDVGTGSFGLTTTDVDAEAHTITVDVTVGQPMLAGSSFVVDLTNANKPTLSGASTVTYRSVDASDVEIETGAGIIASESSQFSFSVTKEFDGMIERVAQDTFAQNADGGATVDVATFNLTNNENLRAAVSTITADIDIEADYTGLAIGEWGLTGPGGAIATIAYPAADTLRLSLAALDLTDTAGGNNVLTLTATYADGGAEVIPQTDFTVDVTLDDTAGTDALSNGLVFASNVNAGEWQLDASVVNVPYLPVGFENLSANVEYSNHGNTAAEIQIEAFDSDGNEYAGSLADAAAKTVTKYSEDEIMDALGLTEKTKLNITFISDADAEDVSIVPYYRDGESRVQSINDQYKK
jgi:hypothetical protein